MARLDRERDQRDREPDRGAARIGAEDRHHEARQREQQTQAHPTRLGPELQITDQRQDHEQRKAERVVVADEARGRPEQAIVAAGEEGEGRTLQRIEAERSTITQINASSRRRVVISPSVTKPLNKRILIVRSHFAWAASG